MSDLETLFFYEIDEARLQTVHKDRAAEMNNGIFEKREPHTSFPTWNPSKYPGPLKTASPTSAIASRRLFVSLNGRPTATSLGAQYGLGWPYQGTILRSQGLKYCPWYTKPQLCKKVWGFESEAFMKWKLTNNVIKGKIGHAARTTSPVGSCCLDIIAPPGRLSTRTADSCELPPTRMRTSPARSRRRAKRFRKGT